ncbi:MAG: hypothetical protein KKA64_03295 [Nanoarchaeota archaeon]|nr:hypothetical protein [Nanoarchaeota archaeon]
MAKKGGLSTLLGFVAWLTGILVSLAVGFAMTKGTLVVPYIPEVVSTVGGWIVVITTLLSVILAIIHYLK